MTVRDVGSGSIDRIVNASPTSGCARQMAATQARMNEALRKAVA